MRRLSIIISLLAVSLLGVLTGCGGSGSKPPGTGGEQTIAAKQHAAGPNGVSEYVGRVGPAGFVAVAIDPAGKASGYNCNGRASESFSGVVKGGKLNLRSDSGAATLTATVTKSTVRGRLVFSASSKLSVGSRTLSFTAKQAHDVGGVYLLNYAYSPQAKTLTASGTSPRGNKITYDVPQTVRPRVPATLTTSDGKSYQASLFFQSRRRRPANSVRTPMRTITLDDGANRGAPATGARPVDPPPPPNSRVILPEP
jgi:hypothetical protein